MYSTVSLSFITSVYFTSGGMRFYANTIFASLKNAGACKITQ